MSNANITGIYAGLFGAFHAATKDKLEKIEFDDFKSRVMRSALIGGNYPEYKTQRTSQGRKRTATTAQQKRDKLKRKNKGRG